jgi:hypothetical protein
MLTVRTIGEYCTVEALEAFLDDWSHHRLENLLLCGILAKYSVESKSLLCLFSCLCFGDLREMKVKVLALLHVLRYEQLVC